MLWKTLFLTLAILGKGRGNKSPNLAWVLCVSGTILTKESMSQSPSGEGIGFSMINLNLYKPLERKLHMAISNCITNCTWGRVKAPFESQNNNAFYFNGAWRVN